MFDASTGIAWGLALSSIYHTNEQMKRNKRRVNMLAQDSINTLDVVEQLEYNYQKVHVFKDGSTMLCGTLTDDAGYAVYLSFEDLQRLALEARLGKVQ